MFQYLLRFLLTLMTLLLGHLVFVICGTHVAHISITMLTANNVCFKAYQHHLYGDILILSRCRKLHNILEILMVDESNTRMHKIAPLDRTGSCSQLIVEEYVFLCALFKIYRLDIFTFTV